MCTGLRTLLLCLLMLLSGHSTATFTPPAQLLNEDASVYLGQWFTVFEDPSLTLSTDDVLIHYRNGEFGPPPNVSAQFGYRNTALWLATPLENATAAAVNLQLDVRYPPLDYIDVYLVRLQQDTTIIDQSFALGDHHPYNQRPIKARTHQAALTFAANSQFILLVRVQSDSSLAVPMYLTPLEQLYEDDHFSQIFMGLFYGIALGLFAYNLFLFLLIRDTVYLTYILYVLGYTLFMASLDGLLFPLWPNAIDWESRSIYIFPWACGIFLSQFCRTILQTREQAPRCDLLLRLFFWLYLVGTLAFFVVDIHIIARINSPVIALNALTILGITIVRYAQGHKAAAYFIAGMGSFCVGLISVAGGAMNLIGHYDLAPTILKIGASIEMILFSIALAQRINSLEASNALAQREVTLARAEALARERFSQKMQEANSHLENAVRARTEFLANMSHEIRTPMNGVLGMIELAQGTQLNHEQRQLLDVAYRSGRTLLALLNDILDLSKIESGKLELEKHNFSLIDLIVDLKNLYSVTLQDKALFFELENADQGPDWIVGDRTRIWQILSNLIGNAIKFTREGGITVTATADVYGHLSLTVKDTGIGISPSAQARIFQAFTQADSSTTRQFGGTGLGLTISRKLAELMNGSLTVESDEGIGSRFTLTIPYVPGQRPPQADRLSGSKPGEIIDATPLRVLVAEDNEVNRLVIRGMLQRLHITPIIVNDGLVALKQCQSEPFDLVLMDLQMPEMDGLQATRAIRGEATLNQMTPIVALTADSMEGDREKCLAAGMSDYLSKPVQLSELKSMILKWTQLHKSQGPSSVSTPTEG
ncbi:MAG: response regulator [Hahellaceae bacterium]|nr:response regulator [Hahellaceae bacterium]